MARSITDSLPSWVTAKPVPVCTPFGQVSVWGDSGPSLSWNSKSQNLNDSSTTGLRPQPRRSPSLNFSLKPCLLRAWAARAYRWVTRSVRALLSVIVGASSSQNGRWRGVTETWRSACLGSAGHTVPAPKSSVPRQQLEICVSSVLLQTSNPL